MQKTAIITGFTGQDGSFLADLLLEKGYRVFGLKRRSSANNLGCAQHLAGAKDLEVVECDITDLTSLIKVTKLARAHEFYNLAAQSHVGTSFSQPAFTLCATGQGALHCLEAIRESGYHTRFYQASTSEMFGGLNPPKGGYTEKSPFHARSPYGCAKLYAHSIAVNYRESYNMFVSCGILFNHESERRGPNFVTRKITQGVAAIKAGLAKSISLGNLDAKRDWGYASDYVRGMWMMLQHSEPEDFVLATGTTVSVRDFCAAAFEAAQLGDYRDYIKIDPNFYRPAEVHALIGNYNKAVRLLGWRPTTSLHRMVKKMVDSDLAALESVAKANVA